MLFHVFFHAVVRCWAERGGGGSGRCVQLQAGGLNSITRPTSLLASARPRTATVTPCPPHPCQASSIQHVRMVLNWGACVAALTRQRACCTCVTALVQALPVVCVSPSTSRLAAAAAAGTALRAAEHADAGPRERRFRAAELRQRRRQRQWRPPDKQWRAPRHPPRLWRGGHAYDVVHAAAGVDDRVRVAVASCWRRCGHKAVGGKIQ